MTEQLERQAELRTALEKTEENARQKNSFIACMSHELRTPLHAILGSSEIISDEILGKLNERQQEHVANIAESASTFSTSLMIFWIYPRLNRNEELDFQIIDALSICQTA